MKTFPSKGYKLDPCVRIGKVKAITSNIFPLSFFFCLLYSNVLVGCFSPHHDRQHAIHLEVKFS